LGSGEERISARLDIIREMKEELIYRDLDLFRKMMIKHLKEYTLFKNFDDFLIHELGLELNMEDLIGREFIFNFKVDSFYHEVDYGEILSKKEMLETMCDKIVTLEPFQTLYDCVSEFDSFFIEDEIEPYQDDYIFITIRFIKPL
jgi:hypothetical protein